MLAGHSRVTRTAPIMTVITLTGAAEAALLLALLDWYHLFGEPTSDQRIFLTASTNETVLLEDGSVESTSGRYVRAGERSGRWLLTNGPPLGLIVLGAMFPVGRLLFGAPVRS